MRGPGSNQGRPRTGLDSWFANFSPILLFCHLLNHKFSKTLSVNYQNNYPDIQGKLCSKVIKSIYLVIILKEFKTKEVIAQ